jgi:hypothetical protein
MTLHSHPMEWVWLGVTIVDLWVSISSWLAAHLDWMRAKELRRSSTQADRQKLASRFAVTHAIAISATLNAALAALLFLAALASLLLPPPPPSYMEVRQSLLVIAVLILVSVLNGAIAIYGRLTRYRLKIGYFESREASQSAGKAAGQVIADSYAPVKAAPEPSTKIDVGIQDAGQHTDVGILKTGPHTGSLVSIQKTGEETKDIAIEIDKKVDRNKAEVDSTVESNKAEIEKLSDASDAQGQTRRAGDAKPAATHTGDA